MARHCTWVNALCSIPSTIIVQGQLSYIKFNYLKATAMLVDVLQQQCYHSSSVAGLI